MPNREERKEIRSLKREAIAEARAQGIPGRPEHQPKNKWLSGSGFVERVKEARYGDAAGFGAATTGTILTALGATTALVTAPISLPTTAIAAGTAAIGGGTAYITGKAVQFLTNAISDRIHKSVDSRKLAAELLAEKHGVENPLNNVSGIKDTASRLGQLFGAIITTFDTITAAIGVGIDTATAGSIGAGAATAGASAPSLATGALTNYKLASHSVREAVTAVTNASNLHEVAASVIAQQQSAAI